MFGGLLIEMCAHLVFELIESIDIHAMSCACCAKLSVPMLNL
jgi:hypothetical protein